MSDNTPSNTRQLKDAELNFPNSWQHYMSLEIQLISEKGVDYSRLRDLLSIGNWKEADRETKSVMLKAVDRENKGYLDIEDIENFPYLDLQTIDRLWLKYSQGKFGFSVQKRIWQKLDENFPEGYPIKCKFGERLGWYVNNEWLIWEELNFSLTAPDGHLPSSPLGGNCLVCDGCCGVLASKLAESNF